MSSRLFQNIREKRGLAYAVFSGLSAYRDAGMLTVYAGCAAETRRRGHRPGRRGDARHEAERRSPTPSCARAKDHLKGSLMLSLESTSSRMSHLARQDIYFDRHVTLDETLAGIEAVTADDVQRVAADLFSNGSLGVTVLGPDSEALSLPPAPAGSRVIARYTSPEMGRIWSDRRRFETWLEVETAAAEVMAEAGIVPREAAPRHPRQGRLRRRAHRRDREGDAARPDRLHDQRRRARRPERPLAALRPDLVGRRRHGAGAADASRRRDLILDRHRDAAAARQAPRRGAPAHADDRPDARRPRRADDLRPEAGALVRASCSATSRRLRRARETVRGRQDLRRGRHLRAPRPVDRGGGLRAARPRAGAGVVADHRSAIATPSC